MILKTERARGLKTDHLFYVALLDFDTLISSTTPTQNKVLSEDLTFCVYMSLRLLSPQYWHNQEGTRNGISSNKGKCRSFVG